MSAESKDPASNLASEQGRDMSTQWTYFQGKLTDAEQDELLLQMIKQLNSMNLRLGEVEARINQNEERSNATVNDKD